MNCKKWVSKIEMTKKKKKTPVIYYILFIIGIMGMKNFYNLRTIEDRIFLAICGILVIVFGCLIIRKKEKDK